MKVQQSTRKSILEWALAIALVVGGVVIWNLAKDQSASAGNHSRDMDKTSDPCPG